MQVEVYFQLIFIYVHFPKLYYKNTVIDNGGHNLNTNKPADIDSSMSQHCEIFQRIVEPQP